jgi:hypothetical protein
MHQCDTVWQLTICVLYFILAGHSPQIVQWMHLIVSSYYNSANRKPYSSQAGLPHQFEMLIVLFISCSTIKAVNAKKLGLRVKFPAPEIHTYHMINLITDISQISVNWTDFAIAPSTTIALHTSKNNILQSSFLFSLEGTLTFFVSKYKMVNGR